eukprot:TRINITY_DN2205_c0_g1_i1.p1 TRINITY_DN2205_c0_g1~~TRINITY_DN2205_c0_g1_i1.p1  ORF type:complete len:327 (-),score=67.84 TRINITY_DN2205_c0_g1_i1:28-1008(-)
MSSREEEGDGIEVKAAIFNPRDGLTESQLETLDQFKANIQDALVTEYERNWCTEMMLCRYLRARNYDLDKSEKMLRDTIAWRREYKPMCITAEDIMIELKNEGKLYRNGKDKLGRPIIYMRPGKDNTGVPEKDVKIRYLVYLLEKCIMSMDEAKGEEKLAWMVDYKNYSQLTGMGMTKMAFEVLNIVQNHYPERLGVAYMVNAPWAFSIFWAMLTPFMSEVTKSKLTFVKSKDPLLFEHIHEDELEVEYGGKNDFQYDYDTHWNKEDSLYPSFPLSCVDIEGGESSSTTTASSSSSSTEKTEGTESEDKPSKDKKKKKKKKKNKSK